MIEYVYIVKCPNCEDEHFHFFDEAKSCAMGYLSDRPIITQVEVERNDFGECTDSHDLGTVWSWEDMMTDAEPAKSIFTRDEIVADYDPDNDPEFDDSVDCEPETSEVSLVAEEVVPRHPVINATRAPKDSEYVIMLKHPKTGKHSVLGRNYTLAVDINKAMTYPGKFSAEDEIKYAEDAAAKRGINFNIIDASGNPDNYYDEHRSDCFFVTTVAEARKLLAERKPIPEGMTIEELVEAMEENEDTVECTWCNDLFDKSECRKEVDLGWLCSRCEAAIKSRGETLTFRENNYWDFLDEELKPKTWICEFDGREIGTVEASTEEEAYEAMEREYPEYHYGLYDGVAIVYPADEDELDENVKEIHDLGNEYDGGYPTEKPELPEIDEVSDLHLRLCPECGKESFDLETGICVECGFN